MSTLTNEEIGRTILGLKAISPFQGYWILADEKHRPIIQNRVEIQVQHDHPNAEACWRDCPNFLTELPAAWRLVDHLREKYSAEFTLTIGAHTEQQWEAAFRLELPNYNELLALAEARLPAAAICLAAESFLFGHTEDLKRLISKLHQLMELKENWDHYGGKPVTSDAANLMNALIRETDLALRVSECPKEILDISMAELFLTHGGAIVLQFPWSYTTDTGLLFTIDPENRIWYSTLSSVMNPDTDKGNIRTENLPEGSSLLGRTLDVIQDYVSKVRSK
jgi:hypothetical protein